MTFPISFSYPWYLIFLALLVPVIWLWRLGLGQMRRGRDVTSLVLRILVLVLLVFGIAGLQWVRASDELAVVFVLDVSDSIDPEARQTAVAFIREALSEMGPDDYAALVLFGSDALVERSLSQAKVLGELLSIPTTGHTDIGEAVRLGLALLPTTAQRRLVLLSDGMDNVSDGSVSGAEMAAQLAAAGGVELDTVALPARSGEEAWIDAVDVPSVLYEGEQFSAVVRVRSLVSQRALVRLFADGSLIAEEPVLLNPGLNSFLFDLTATETGFSTFAAQLVPQKDVFYQNNVLGAFSMVRGSPRVLVVARAAYEDKESGETVDDAAALVRALESAGLQIDRLSPAYMPADLASLGEYASVVLVNVPAPELAPRQMALLQAYVRDLGRGLVCVGGEESYGVGGYFRTPLEETLPVEMSIKDKERMPPLAIVFVIDRSGSMDAAASAGGPRKLDLAKEAILRSLELMNPGDRVGVVAFESTAQWVWPISELEDIEAIQQQVMTIRGGGGTDIRAGLSAAVTALEQSDARLKHVILLTDGGASQEGLQELALRLKTLNGTLSTIGVGQDAAAFLRPLAIEGGGRYHFTDNPATIPQIFAQETTLAKRAYIVEETFYPSLAGRSAILEDIDAVPALYGYVATSTKPAAQMILVSNQQDPILAQWQYGLGRSVAWTSDAKGQWARLWVAWEQFPRFWVQAVRWTVIERAESDLETQITDDGSQAHIAVDVVGKEGEYGNALEVTAYLISPSLEQTLVPLPQTAPGRYEGDFSPQEEGVYLVRIVGMDAADSAATGDGSQALTQVTGFVRTYSPEYRAFGADEFLLRRLAEAGGGELLSDATQVFTHDQEVVRTFSDVWPWLLGMAVCLLPLDVGVRRVVIDWSDLRAAWKRVRARWRGLVRRKPAVEQPSERHLSRLMAAKSRAQVEPGIEPPSVSPIVPEAATGSSVELESGTGSEPWLAAESGTEPEAESTQAAAPGAGGEQESLTLRLLEAKKRARRRQNE
ncbi:MAG: VWA domain-containing protein [Anaerolineae bacterium]|nr:VWA domain-containing protein [Anaerolineae bacterium]